jgi:hypothetical protein
MNTTHLCRKHSLVWIALALLLWTAAHSASAQVVPALQQAPDVRIFSTFTDVKPNFRGYNDFAVFGFSLGGYLQTRHVIGAELRGSITRWGGDQHQESILAGPRASLHFAHFAPYVAILGGAGNSWAWSNPPKPGLPKPVNTEETSSQWSILGGLDVHVKHSLSLRIGELSYSWIYRKDQTITPLSVSAGVVYRLNWRSRYER